MIINKNTNKNINKDINKKTDKKRNSKEETILNNMGFILIPNLETTETQHIIRHMTKNNIMYGLIKGTDINILSALNSYFKIVWEQEIKELYKNEYIKQKKQQRINKINSYRIQRNKLITWRL